MAIFINGYWWLFHCKPLVVILLMVIDGYFINDYCIIIFFDILCYNIIGYW